MAEDLSIDLGDESDDLLADVGADTGAETTPEVPADDAAMAQEDGDAIDAFAKETEPQDAAARKTYWQAALTRARQKDRERYGKIEEEHGKYAEVLRNFFSDDDYARQVVAQRFPHLAQQLSGRETPAQSQGTPSGSAGVGKLASLIQAKLGTELGFLAPTLAEAIQEAASEALAPIQRQTREQQEQARRRQEEAVLAEMDSRYPGWEDRHGKDIRELQQFLSSNEVTHPKYGNRYELLYKLTNRDQGRIDAIEGMRQAARSRVATGRTGRTAPPNVTEQVAKAKSSSEAFRLAAEAALADLRGG